MRIFDAKNPAPFPPFDEVQGSGRVWGKQRALLYLEAISHCVFRVWWRFELFLLGRSSVRQEKVGVPPTHSLFSS